ncbi:hypothetical protein GCM10011608_49530 [Micromonospora sonchi]|uniref:Uncharacterized protein n=1 Tax=Micromonospora sonchi TaxID=1763543 RepID=A0A917U6B6_9ACTN|nr:hypothetical protein GCM10011608_49530 [Micromonospora sonchi]
MLRGIEERPAGSARASGGCNDPGRPHIPGVPGSRGRCGAGERLRSAMYNDPAPAIIPTPGWPRLQDESAKTRHLVPKFRRSWCGSALLGALSHQDPWCKAVLRGREVEG